MRASDNLNAWRVLAALRLGGGIRRASIETGLDSPQCTRLLQALEEDLGLSLVAHGTRPVSLTPAAEALTDDVERMLGLLDRVRTTAAGLAEGPVTFVFGIPSNTSRESSFRIIKRFLTASRNCSLMMAADADHETVLEGGVDAAYLPYAPEPVPGLGILPLGPIGNVPVASPEYLARRGTPLHPKDLARHDVILRGGRHYPKTEHLERGLERSPLVFHRVTWEGDSLMGREAVLSGEGVALDLSLSLVSEGIETGRLVPVLSGWHRPYWRPSVVFRRDHPQAARLERFAVFFHEEEQAAVVQRQKTVEELLAKVRAGTFRTGL